MMKNPLRPQTPAARLEFLEYALGPQIKDAERQAAAQAAATRAATLASRVDELATIDGEIARLEKSHAKLGLALDEATRRFRDLQDQATRSHLELYGANVRRSLTHDRYERALAVLGNDSIAKARYRIKWMAQVAADHIGTRPAPAVLKLHERPIDFPTLTWIPATLAEVTAKALLVVEALTLAPVSPTDIESTVAAELAKCYAAAGPSLLRAAPWATFSTNEAMH